MPAAAREPPAPISPILGVPQCGRRLRAARAIRPHLSKLCGGDVSLYCFFAAAAPRMNCSAAALWRRREALRSDLKACDAHARRRTSLANPLPLDRAAASVSGTLYQLDAPAAASRKGQSLRIAARVDESGCAFAWCARVSNAVGVERFLCRLQRPITVHFTHLQPHVTPPASRFVWSAHGSRHPDRSHAESLSDTYAARCRHATPQRLQ